MVDELDAQLADFIHEGYVHLKGAIDPVDVAKLLTAEEGKSPSFDGTKKVDASDPTLQKIQSQVDKFASRAAELAGLECMPALALGPKKITAITMKPGVSTLFPWHLDHFSYYRAKNHEDWIICYLPILKGNARDSNLCLVPYTALSPSDRERTRSRGAMRFLQVTDSNASAIKAGGVHLSEADHGKWCAIDDFNDDVGGFIMETDIEVAKVTPQLQAWDLLLMRADVIHRTADANVHRIALRFDYVPRALTRKDHCFVLANGFPIRLWLWSDNLKNAEALAKHADVLALARFPLLMKLLIRPTLRMLAVLKASRRFLPGGSGIKIIWLFPD